MHLPQQVAVVMNIGKLLLLLLLCTFREYKVATCVRNLKLLCERLMRVCKAHVISSAFCLNQSELASSQELGR